MNTSRIPDRGITYAKPTLQGVSLRRKVRHLALVARLAMRCALKGHEWQDTRPTRLVRVSSCRICGTFIGTSVLREDPDHSCFWYRPSMRRPITDMPTHDHDAPSHDAEEAMG